MLLALNRRLFVTVLFSLQAGLVCTFLYGTMLTVFFLAEKRPVDFSFLLGTSAYVFLVSSVSAGFSFLLSLMVRKLSRVPHLKSAALFYGIIAAVLANAAAAAAVGIGLHGLNFVIYAASLAAIYAGRGLYQRAWRAIDALDAL